MIRFHLTPKSVLPDPSLDGLLPQPGASPHPYPGGLPIKVQKLCPPAQRSPPRTCQAGLQGEDIKNLVRAAY